MPRAPQDMIRALRAFVRARQGATAVEFAFIAVPLLMLIFGILELALVFMMSGALETATNDAARRIRTGELQNSGGDRESFTASVCERMSWLGDACEENLNVSVQTYPDYTSLENDPPMGGEDFDDEKTCWSPGGPRDIVLVRTYYQWRIFTPLLNSALVNTGTNTRRLIATDAFRNEPYGDAPRTGAGC